MMTNLPARVASHLILAASLCVADPALGQVDDRVVAAESLFRDGLKLLEASRCAEAADKFAASYQLDRSWGPLHNLAHCHEQMGKTATAWAEFREAISMARASGRNERVELSSARAHALEPQLVRLQITVDDKTPGLVVTRNGSAVDPATWGAAVPVDPGSYMLEVNAPEKIAWRTTVHAAGAGQITEIRVPRLADTTLPFWQQHRASTLTLGGAAAVAGVGASIAGWALVSHSTVGADCAGKGGSQCDALDGVRNKVVAADVLFGVAGLAAVTSVILFFTVERKSAASPSVGRVSGSPMGFSIRF